VGKKKGEFVVFDFRGVVDYEFVPPGQIVNLEYYLSAMHRLREALRLKRPELWAATTHFNAFQVD